MSTLFLQREAEISPDGLRRWMLRRRWGEGQPILFLGHNCSRADAEVDDMSVLRWMNFTRAWGFNAMSVGNLYPYRATHPKDCRRWLASLSLDDHHELLTFNRRYIWHEAAAAAMVVVCWGNLCASRDDENAMVDFLRANGHKLYCLGTTKDGAPKHPMARGVHRVPNDQQPIIWTGRAA